jgi:putative DNA primase/helicase
MFRVAADPDILPTPSAPMAVAREFTAREFTHPDGPLVIYHWRGGWWRWRTTHWAELEARAVRELAYRFTEGAQYEKTTKNGVELVPWAPNRHKIADLLEALAAVTHLTEDTPQPSWLTHGEHPDGVVVSCANGLLEVATRRLWPHTPTYFNTTAVAHDFDPDALDPVHWEAFLETLWGEDREQVKLLQEWMGYTISGRTHLHKIALVVGPTRGGKGAIGRVLGALIGPENVAAPTLSSLGGDFGCAPLIGNSLALIADARLNGRSTTTVVERLLSISGEDVQTINRKFRDAWTGQLTSRFMILSNELPQLGDASSAIAGRFVTLLLTESWLGREDHSLEAGLHSELPEILNWSLAGLTRLEEQGRFTVPESTETAYVALQELASPVRAFLRERCITGSDQEVAIDDLWKAWRSWAEDNGHGKGGTRQVFGRDLRATLPRLKVGRRGPRGDQERIYQGVALLPEGEDEE